MPRFQRSFRWDQSDVDQLFDSINRGFPIGSLLLWQRDAPAGAVTFGSLEVEATKSSEAYWVVDGQQRLTALVATLTDHENVAPQFELYFDLEKAEFVRRGQRKLVPLSWLPMKLLLDTPELLDYLMAGRESGLDEGQIRNARQLSATIAEYEIPLNVVRTNDERVLRDIFHRLNSAGHRLAAAEVFRALHASLEPGDEGDLRTLFDSVGSKGFGSLRDDTVLRCVLAVRGGDVYRSFEDEFKDGTDPAETFKFTEDAMERVFSFLREDAAIPHVRALPYNGVLPILTRFFHLHPEPQPRSRNLLRRWVWRGSMAWGRDVGMLRKAVQDIGPDEHLSIKTLLKGLGDDESLNVDLNAVQLNKAATRMNLALLSSMGPRSFVTGVPIDVGILLEEDGPEALVELAPRSKPRLAGRILYPPTDEADLIGQMIRADEIVLSSHAISKEAIEALGQNRVDDFIRLRAVNLGQRLTEQRRRLAEPEAADHPPLSALAVPDI